MGSQLSLACTKEGSRRTLMKNACICCFTLGTKVPKVLCGSYWLGR